MCGDLERPSAYRQYDRNRLVARGIVKRQTPCRRRRERLPQGLFGNGFACPPDHLCVRRVLHRGGHFESPEKRQRLCHRKRQRPKTVSDLRAGYSRRYRGITAQNNGTYQSRGLKAQRPYCGLRQRYSFVYIYRKSRGESPRSGYFRSRKRLCTGGNINSVRRNPQNRL